MAGSACRPATTPSSSRRPIAEAPRSTGGAGCPRVTPDRRKSPRRRTHPRIQRRLAAILAADVVGYSRLMQVDEEATLDRLKVLWRDILLFAGDHARAEDLVLRALRINPLPAA